LLAEPLAAFKLVAKLIDFVRRDGQCLADLAHDLQPGPGATSFDEVNGAGRDAGFASEVSLTEELVSPDLSQTRHSDGPPLPNSFGFNPMQRREY
jgi:hypothetical protein